MRSVLFKAHVWQTATGGVPPEFALNLPFPHGCSYNRRLEPIGKPPKYMPFEALQPPRSDATIESRVESVCQLGCRKVRQSIATLEQGGDIPETGDLSPNERGRLLAELKSIMAVYGDTCRID